ncbi:MAG: hypothetical protein IJC93_02980 [Clostridia bacterium]|nr:hypothetical protein [Clostridia bacterium]
MTKLDFSGVKDARVGEREVQRIYRGDTKVWNKYCWEKWGCARVTIYSLSGEFTGETVEWVNPDRIVYGGTLYSKRTTYAAAGYYRFSNNMPNSNFTMTELYDLGYRYLTENEQVNVGETYLRLSGISYREDGTKIMNIKQYEVKQEKTVGDYTKGSKSYGVVEGYSGDYPDNGRHSDGYWYVRVDPVGVKEG